MVQSSTCIAELHLTRRMAAGAGPAGLTAALAIRAAVPGVKVTVLERAREMHPNGGNIGLVAGTLWKALRAIGPNVEQAVMDASLKRHTMITCAKDGSKRVPREVDARNVSWFDLQQALLSQLPDGIVKLKSAAQEVWRWRVALRTQYAHLAHDPCHNRARAGSVATRHRSRAHSTSSHITHQTGCEVCQVHSRGASHRLLPITCPSCRLFMHVPTVVPAGGCAR